MTGVLLAAILLAGAAASLAVRALTMSRAAAARVVARTRPYGYADLAGAPSVVRAPRRHVRLSGTRAAGAVAAVRRLLLGGAEDEVRALLRGAGLYGVAPGSFAALRLGLLALAVFTGAALLLGSLPPALAVLLAAVLVAIAWLLPPAELRRRRDARLRLIDRGLGDLVEFLVVTVEAGVGLGSAFATAATRFRGPLGEELRVTVQEQAMGLSTEEALRNFLARCDTPMSRSFVRSVLQAETLGTSVGQILRGLSVEMRRRRRQAAEELAHKAPVKIVFPLAFLILPAMFLIVVGPAVRSLFATFGG